MMKAQFDIWSLFPIKHFLHIFSPDMSQISSNLLRKAFATCQHAFLFTTITFYDIFPRACAELEIFFCRVISFCNLVPRASFPLTSGRRTRALGASISGMPHRYHTCRVRTVHACAVKPDMQNSVISIVI